LSNDRYDGKIYVDLLLRFESFIEVIKANFFYVLEENKNVLEKSPLFINMKSLILFYKSKRTESSMGKRKRNLNQLIIEAYSTRITELTDCIRRAKDRLTYQCKNKVVLSLQGIV
jgi:hypothetical protein